MEQVPTPLEKRAEKAPERELSVEGSAEKANPVFESTRYVVEHADHVLIDQDALSAFAEGFEVPDHGNWMRESFDLSGLTEDEQAMLSTTFNSVSFSYWGDPYWSVTWNGTSYDRASWSMVAAILRSKDEGRSLLDPNILSTITQEELGHALRGNTEIPMLEERTRILNLVGQQIHDRGKGSILNIVREADGDALRLVDLILKDFSPAFDDQYEYKGRTVYFNKRAQALVESLHSMFEGKGNGAFTNINELSALADYIIPNLLRNAGILKYSEELAGHIDAKQEIEKGSAYEVELRSGVVQAIELLRLKILEKTGKEIETAAINDGLWLKGGEIETPFHLVRTTAY